MTFQHPLEIHKGYISCPTCATRPQHYLQHSKKNISSIEIPSYQSLDIKNKKEPVIELQILIVLITFSIMLIAVLSLFKERK